ncbi:hypothetical protein ACHAXT_009931 [Thalassiosira profunda]
MNPAKPSTDAMDPPPPSPASTVAGETARQPDAAAGQDEHAGAVAGIGPSAGGGSDARQLPPSSVEVELPSAAGMAMQPPPAAAAVAAASGIGGNPPPPPPSVSSSSGATAAAAIALEGGGTAAVLKGSKAPAANLAFQPIAAAANVDISSSSESEHLTFIPATMAASAASHADIPPGASSSLSTGAALVSSSNHSTQPNDARLRSAKAASHPPSHQSCPSRPSSLSSKSRGSQGSRPRPHAYFASSEEESEAELDEMSHSSRDHRRNDDLAAGLGRRVATGGGHLGKSSMRGSRKLAEIASEVGSSSAHLHGSRVRMTIPAGHKESGEKPTVPSIYKAAASDRGAVPPPPPMVTVAVGQPEGLGATASGRLLPSPLAGPPPAMAATGPRSGKSAPSPALGGPTVRPAGRGAYATSPARKRTRKKKRGRSPRHLPRGLPVFKDPRSCMWTSTHDANAPSEDRYSSLVNVLLRPPKTPRGGRPGNAKGEGENNNNGNGNEGGGSQSGSSRDGSSGDSPAEDSQRTAAAGTAQQTATTETATQPSDRNDAHDDDDEDNTSLVRLSLWSVIDGHGGGCVATYAAEVLLPHIAASVARALNSEIVDRGVCSVNGQLRDANALDLDGLIRSSDRRVRQREAGIDAVNPNSIHYRSPCEDSESEAEDNLEADAPTPRNPMRSESESEAESTAPVGVASSPLPGHPVARGEGDSASSAKASVKTAASPAAPCAPVGTHSPAEVAAVTRAITDSFLAVDEGWINSIDPVTTHQTSCVSNGRWNAGACALVVFLVQRLDWRRDRPEIRRRNGAGQGFHEDTLHNEDAARRRKLDYAAKKCKSVSSLSTLSSTSSLGAEAAAAAPREEEGDLEDLETEDEFDDIFGPRRRRRKGHLGRHHRHRRLDDDDDDDPMHRRDGHDLIATPGACQCHSYRPNDAMLYTAHVGDCRAVMLGSAPPRTIQVPPEGKDGAKLSLDHSEESSADESIADEISSSEHDPDSSDEERPFHSRSAPSASAAPGGTLGYVRASKRPRRGEKVPDERQQPFVPLPPLRRRESSSEESLESDDTASTTATREHPPPVERILPHAAPRLLETEDETSLRSVRSGSPTQMDRPPSPTQLVVDPVHLPPPPLSARVRPIDLTTDHSAYNPAEAAAVLRRCRNAPKAISSASGGGIKRVAGSLAVTRALGDAYLKTPRLSFFPYKRHAPYITARPEVNCRVLTKDADRILTLATDGVWERASGDDVLRWVRNYYNARIAGGTEEPHLETFQRHDPYGRDALGEGMARRKGGPEVLVGGASGHELGSSEMSSEDDAPAVNDNAPLTSSVDNTTTETPEEESVASPAHSAVAAASETTAATTTADETTATAAKAGTKRKRPDPAAAVDDSTVSSRSVSTAASSRGGALGGVRALPRRRATRAQSRSLAIPTVSEVIVRKVLNEVRKTRNISSLRILMNLPKGRARRSKHDDITATVVDLSGFVS